MEPTETNSLQLLSDCLVQWLVRKKSNEESNTLQGASFNPLNLIPIKETTHSRILGDILNPRGSHGQGCLFLKLLLVHLDVPNPDQGDWQVSVEEGRVDVMIWRREPNSVILIENKARGAVDQQNQLYRYWHENIYWWKPDLDYESPEVRANYKLIYMPADDSKWPEKHSVSRPDYLKDINPRYKQVPIKCQRLLFAEFGELLRSKALPAVPETNHRLLSFLSFYIEIWTI